MIGRTTGQLACLSAVSLLAAAGASVSAAERVIVGEKYTADLIGPSAVDSFAERQARGVDQGMPTAGELHAVPRAPDPAVPERETLPQTAGAGELTGSLPSLGLNFEGARSPDDSIQIPPDTMGAIGPNHFMEVINGNVSIFQKCDGLRIASESLASFFSGSGVSGRIGDPRVLFDHHSGRWIVIATTFGGGKIALAVSLSDNPTGLFLKTHFVAAAGSDEGFMVDYPTLGVNENGIYIGAFMWGNDSMTIWAIDKAPLIANPPSLGTVTAWRGLEYNGGNQPAHTYGTPGSEYIIGKSTQSTLRIYRVDPPLTDPTLLELETVPVEYFYTPPNAPALGGIYPINTVDDRLMISVYRDGGMATFTEAAAAVDYCVANDIKVSNNSYGLQTDLCDRDCDVGDCAYYSCAVLFNAIKNAQAAGHLFVASAGNMPTSPEPDNDAHPHYPDGFDLPNIISVAATDNDDLYWNDHDGTSHHGAIWVDLGAPGDSIYTTRALFLGGGYQHRSGTSMAAPHVTGVAALLMSHYGWDWETTQARIFSTVRKTEAMQGRVTEDWAVATGGVLNAMRALWYDCDGNGLDDYCDLDCGAPGGPCNLL